MISSNLKMIIYNIPKRLQINIVKTGMVSKLKGNSDEKQYYQYSTIIISCG